jgi:UDP-N-acetylglucosamine--N-acetylmuramyl-(pentapeptide) pyrophosphoryl-undecaprenol N-acetylglucosamine transferase
LIVGGSQGARVFNRTLPAAVQALPPALRPRIWHQTGRAQCQQTEQAYRAAEVEAKVVPFIDDMAAAYAWADLVICRAGAMTIAELAAVGVASVLVPFPHATDDHQTANARFLAGHDAAILVPENEFSAPRLTELLQTCGQSRELLVKMANHARACAMPDATQMVARLCQEAMHA